MTSPEPISPPASLRPAFAGAAATFSGLGLARFAYVPLFPAMVAAGWVSGAEAGLLGALNLAGYLVGVGLSRPLGRQLGTRRALDLGMVLAVLAFAGTGWNGGAAWLAGCRGLAGIAGGVLMVLAGPAVQGAVPPERRGLAGGIVLAGVGTGTITGAIVVPALLRMGGVQGAWLGLAMTVLVLWLLARSWWPDTPVPVSREGLPGGTGSLALAYGLSAAGLVPHMVYLADLAVRGRGMAVAQGAATFLFFGLGGLAGALSGGRAADRFGGTAAIRLALAVQAAAVALALVPATLTLFPSAFGAGVAAVGISTATLARAREMAGPASGAIWAAVTAAFALAQAGTGLALAWLFARTGSHALLFGLALVLSLAAFLPLWPRGSTAGPAAGTSGR